MGNNFSWLSIVISILSVYFWLEMFFGFGVYSFFDYVGPPIEGLANGILIFGLPILSLLSIIIAWRKNEDKKFIAAVIATLMLAIILSIFLLQSTKRTIVN